MSKNNFGLQIIVYHLTFCMNLSSQSNFILQNKIKTNFTAVMNSPTSQHNLLITTCLQDKNSALTFLKGVIIKWRSYQIWVGQN